MRELGFAVRFSKSNENFVYITVLITKDYSAQELLNDEIIDDSFENFGEILGLSKGIEDRLKVIHSSKYQITISAPISLVSRPWEIASMLNILDGANFLMEDDNVPFWKTVEVTSPYDISLDILYADLEHYLDECRQAMTNYLPENFIVDDYLGRQWPVISGNYMYTVVLKMSVPLPPEVQKITDRLMTNMDQLSAESAFEMTVSPLEWWENGVLPYPVEIHVEEASISYSIEMPPSDFAPNLLLMQQILQRNFDVDISEWNFEIREGW